MALLRLVNGGGEILGSEGEDMAFSDNPRAPIL